MVEFAPGFRARPVLEPEWVPAAVTRALGLTLELDPQRIPSSVALPNGGFLALSRHTGDAAEAIRAHSPRDAERWATFTATMHELAGFLEALYQVPPTDLDNTSLGDLP